MPEIPAIHAEALTRVYKIRGGKKKDPKELVALKDVNIKVPRSELFGLLGPNGAGKTTLIKVLTTLLAPTSGRACVAGFDVMKEPHEIRARINMVSGGESSGYGLLTVRENLWMFSQFYGIPSKEANRRIKELLEVVGLGDRLNTKSSDLSSGLRQKMNIVRGFMTDPEVLFLDEPTASIDPEFETDLYDFLKELNRDVTIVVITHDIGIVSSHMKSIACVNKHFIFHAGGQISQEMIDMAYQCPVDLIAHGLPHRVLPTHKEK